MPCTSIRHMRQLPAIDSRSWKQKRGISAPAASHACSSVNSGGTSISLPSMTSFVITLLRRDHMCGIENADIVDIGLARIFVDAFLDLVTEMRDQALDRPCRGIAERADGVTLDLLCHCQQHVDLALVGAALGHPSQHPPHPPRSFAAWRALAATLVLVEIGNPRDRPDQIGRFVHHDNRGGAEAGAQFS